MINQLASKFESLALSVVRLKNKYPPLFIVGAPRSGTTLVYLHIVNAFHFAYFPNISKWHPQAYISWAIWGKMRYQYAPTYDNAYGVSNGPLAPSDGWRIFHKWFPEYDYSRSVDETHLHELRSIVRIFEIIFQSPFANKNNSNSVRIEYLSKLFPDAFFIYVKRDIVDAALSLLAAQKKLGVSLDKWWGVAPPQYYDRHFSSEIEKAVYQIWGVDSYIRESLSQLDRTRWVQTNYEEFCADPDHMLNWVRSQYALTGIALQIRETSLPAKFEQRPKAGHTGQAEQIFEVLHQLETEVY